MVTKLGVTGLVGMLVSFVLVPLLPSFFLHSFNYFAIFVTIYTYIVWDWVYRYRGTNPGPTIAFRADMDGLPVNERAEGFKDESWISKNKSVMHACGHDGHVTSELLNVRYNAFLEGVGGELTESITRLPVLLAFARAVVAKYKPSDIFGTIVFLFQPAEESDGGAPRMLEDGVLTAGGLLKDIDYFYGIHLSSGIPVGVVATKSGPLMAGIDILEIEVKGVGGHGAMPHQTVDSILVATNLVTQLHSIISRNVDPVETGVLTIGKINAGTANNVIADDAQIVGTIRYFNEAVRDTIHTRIKDLCAGLSIAYKCKITPNIISNYPCTVNHPRETDIVLEAASKIVGPMALRVEKGVMASEDFSFFLQKRPGAFFFVGASPDPTRLHAFPHHSPAFDFGEGAMEVGASIWMQLFEDLLVSPGVGAGKEARL